MRSIVEKMSMRERVQAVLQGKRPDHIPFIDRFEVWYRSHTRAGTLPDRFQGMSVNDVHRNIGMGQEMYLVPYALKMRGVEVISTFNGEVVFHEWEPVMEFFCGLSDLVGYEKAGVTVTELITPVGRLRVKHELLEENIVSGTEPYMKEHLIKEDADYRTVEYILERQEFVPRFQKVSQEEERLGDIGFVVPMTPRIPFQQVLLEYLGEIPFFYALKDTQEKVERLISVLDMQLTNILQQMDALPGIYIEFPDNLHGLMTNPKLFRKYCLPHYQKYTEILHNQGKKVGTHTDGNMKPLLHLLPESGLDVAESFSPAPLTPCSFDEAWFAWQNGPIIWGGIPSPILEERTSETEFVNYIYNLLDIVGNQPIILGIGDMVMGHNSIDRVRYIVEQVEQREIV